MSKHVSLRNRATGQIIDCAKIYSPWSWIDACGNLYHRSEWEVYQLMEV